MYGTVHDKESLFLRTYTGNADQILPSGEKITYELANGGFGNGGPIIRSSKTGQWWSITWQQLINLAIAEGINEPLPAEAEKAVNHAP